MHLALQLHQRCLTNLTSGTISTTNLSSTNLTSTNINSTNFTTTNLSANNISANSISAGTVSTTNVSALNGFVTNMTSTATSTTNLSASNASVTNITYTNASVINLNVDNAAIARSLVVAPGASVDMGGNRVQNVGNGVLDSDAANMGQLRQITNSIDQVKKLANQQGAIAAALNNLPMPAGLSVGETTIGAAVGFSGGESALSVGFGSSIAPNVMIKGSAGVAGSTTSVGVGIGYTFK